MTDSLELDALDQSETRLQRVQSNLQRIDKKAQLLVGDATDPTDWFNGEAYDRILADVPCSASGVIRRNPDIKLLRRESDIMPMLRQQRQILEALWGLLKPGGKMLYSTCSIFKDENEHQIGEFVESHNDCVELPITGVPWGEPRTHGRQILPGPHDMDGFYYALLQKDALN
jgi:16S rRNA (cytosine967-C5)-methyltransferase